MSRVLVLTILVKYGYPPKPLPESDKLASVITRGEQLIVTALPPRSPIKKRRPSVKELDEELSAPRPPVDPPAPGPLAESPLTEGDIPIEAAESVALPGRDAGFLQLRVVPDDNSCLFSAVGVVFEGGIGAASKLRKGGLELWVLC